ncbi:MAG TPA: hypothetical protein ENH85_02605 [Candidatus Scalindua sp.]|nr:hypothetical protein [Candidatus Scalindua sp.]
MTGVTKEDINRIYDKLEPIAKDVAVIKMQMEDHLTSHKTWRDTFIGGIIKISILFIVGFFSYIWGKK